MSRENVEMVKRWVQAYNGRDMTALDDLIEPDFEFLPYLATLIETTVYRGHDGLRRYFADADAAWGNIQVQLDDEIREVDDDRTVCSGELLAKGRASGMDVRVTLAFVIESRHGKLTRCETYASKAEAVEALGLRE